MHARQERGDRNLLRRRCLPWQELLARQMTNREVSFVHDAPGTTHASLGIQHLDSLNLFRLLTLLGLGCLVPHRRFGGSDLGTTPALMDVIRGDLLFQFSFLFLNLFLDLFIPSVQLGNMPSESLLEFLSQKLLLSFRHLCGSPVRKAGVIIHFLSIVEYAVSFDFAAFNEPCALAEDIAQKLGKHHVVRRLIGCTGFRLLRRRILFHSTLYSAVMVEPRRGKARDDCFDTGPEDRVERKLGLELGDKEFTGFTLFVDVSLLPSERDQHRYVRDDIKSTYRIILFLSTFGCSSMSESSESCAVSRRWSKTAYLEHIPLGVVERHDAIAVEDGEWRRRGEWAVLRTYIYSM